LTPVLVGEGSASGPNHFTPAETFVFA
jgi:hypothetical protein